MEKRVFGKLPDGREAHAYTIKNNKGMSAVITDFGAIVVDLNVPFGDGAATDVVLGYDDVTPYLENGCFFGAVIAPNANRIADAQFEIDGTTYHVDKCDGVNNLHSHYSKGAHKRLWEVKEYNEDSIVLSLGIPDGDIGFPGNFQISIKYSITEDNGLSLEYESSADKKTIINPTNHSYFNLLGHDGGSITEHTLKLKASGYTYVREGSIPTGEITAVKDTVFDFTSHRRIQDNIDDDLEQLNIPGGYDHNFVIDDYKKGVLQEVAQVKDPSGNRTMTVYSDLPGIQFYAGNFITEQDGKKGAHYGKRCALCLETDYFPDAVHHPNFPSSVYDAGEKFISTTIYKFS